MKRRPRHLTAAACSALLLAGCRGCPSAGDLLGGGSAPTGAMHPPAGFTAAAIGVGSNHVCALRDDGAVWCWGRDNGYGQLGDGTGVLHRDPRAVPGLRDAIAIAAGFQHTCALLRGGEVRCWGENHDGQLGDGTRDDRSAPVAVVGLPRARAIHAGPLTTCAEAEGSGLWCWGRLPATGSEPGAWGGCYPQPRPQAVAGVDTPLLGLSIAFEHLCAIPADGLLRCWGNGYLGALGDATKLSRVAPALVPGLPAARAVAAGLSFSSALVAGDLQGWGFRFPRDAGTALPPACEATPCVIAAGRDLVSLAAADDVLCAIDRAGAVQCLGDKGLAPSRAPTTWLGPGLTTVPMGGPVAALSLGDTFGCAIERGGGVTCFEIVDPPRSGPPVPGRPAPRR